MRSGPGEAEARSRGVLASALPTNSTNCKGSYFNEIGYKYVGEFKNGKILEGIATYPGGTKYLGQFKDDEPHGRGTFLYSNGTKYYGEWKNGKNHGNGTKMWNDGRKYVGEFKDDKPHGQGTFTYVDGNTFTGKFVAGSEHGKGHCTNQDGSIIECKVQKNENTKNFGGKVRRNISIVARKWVNLSEYNSFSDKAKKVMKKLESDFKIKASELCSTNGKFNILTKRIELLDMDETPAFGLEPKVQLGIKGSVECI